MSVKDRHGYVGHGVQGVAQYSFFRLKLADSDGYNPVKILPRNPGVSEGVLLPVVAYKEDRKSVV